MIPVWDAPFVDALPEAVASAGRQVPRPRIVVVDNASRDPLPELSRVEIVRSQTRLSRGGARNLGLSRVATEFVLFLDADDVMLDGAVALLESELARVPDAVVCAGAILDRVTGRRHRVPHRVAYPLSRARGWFAVANAAWSLYPSQGAAVMRTAAVRDAGGYGDADEGEDWVLRASLAFRGRVALVDTPAFRYAQRGEAPRGARLREAAGRVRDRIRADPGIPRWAKAMLPAIALAQMWMIGVIHPLAAAVGARRESRVSTGAAS